MNVRAKWSVPIWSVVLLACPAPAPRTTHPDTATDEGDESLHREPRSELRRVGLVASGEYLVELDGDDGTRALTRAHLARIAGEDLELTLGGAGVRLSRESGWPMLCLTRAAVVREGGLAIRLQPGAAVYVVAADGVDARIALAPSLTHSIVVPRAHLALEPCAGPPSDSEPPAHAIAETGSGDQPCVFPDPEPVDESDGLAVPSGAAIEVLEQDGVWSRVRVARTASSVEGWVPTELVASERVEVADWAAAALRGGRCVFPGRRAVSAMPRAWLERSDPAAPPLPREQFEEPLRASDARVRACWDERPASERTARGRVEARLAIDGDGQVEVAAIVRSVRAPRVVLDCMVERMRRIRFPPPRSGVTLRRTYDLEPAAADPTPAPPTE